MGYRDRQRGAVIVTVALVLLFLLGFMGIALDFGHLFIVKTELQTAMDSCALAAAQELDGKNDSIQRAKSAGITAGNLNRVDLQSPDWRSQGQITEADFTFLDADYEVTTVESDAEYAECRHTQNGVGMWLLHIMGAFTGNTTDYPNTRNVVASAVATRSSAQTTCPIPVGLKPKAGGTAPDYGFQVGEWVKLIVEPGASQQGEIGWYNLDGSTNASETIKELSEPATCETKIGDTLGTPGVQAAVAEIWNYRFGIYKNGDLPSDHHPDFTGYAYTAQNWKNPPPQNAYSGTPAVGSDPTADSFVNKRLAFASCADTGTQVRGADSCESITGVNLNSFQNLAAPGNTTGGHRQYGYNRRIALVPVIDGSNKVQDYACMLLLQPLSIPMADVELEYLGNAATAGSPCTTNGLPGASAGPLVPVLVR
ncbi:MAG TPA: TadE/TadG family type IV pilus assembly protein [Burkholderiaceae bacterium]|nr:TadE/TadG family type IV pilus assembly protein [Burkholderiaceae bacterium]